MKDNIIKRSFGFFQRSYNQIDDDSSRQQEFARNQPEYEIREYNYLSSPSSQYRKYSSPLNIIPQKASSSSKQTAKTLKKDLSKNIILNPASATFIAEQKLKKTLKIKSLNMKELVDSEVVKTNLKNINSHSKKLLNDTIKVCDSGVQLVKSMTGNYDHLDVNSKEKMGHILMPKIIQDLKAEYKEQQMLSGSSQNDLRAMKEIYKKPYLRVRQKKLLTSGEEEEEENCDCDNENTQNDYEDDPESGFGSSSPTNFDDHTEKSPSDVDDADDWIDDFKHFGYQQSSKIQNPVQKAQTAQTIMSRGPSQSSQPSRPSRNHSYQSKTPFKGEKTHSRNTSKASIDSGITNCCFEFSDDDML